MISLIDSLRYPARCPSVEVDEHHAGVADGRTVVAAAKDGIHVGDGGIVLHDIADALEAT